MAELLKLRQAARLIGVSPGRLYRAITDGRLAAAPGGGPGKPTLVSLEAVQTFCRSEGLRVPDAAEILERSERSERAERSGRSGRSERHMAVPQELETLAGQYLARIMERQSNYFDLFLKAELTHLVERVVEQVVERLAERFTGSLERSERAERPERSRPAPSLQAASTPASAPPGKADVVIRIRTLRDASLSLQQIADLFNAEALPTLSGKGRWQKGTIGNLLAQGDAAR